jgi:hypothetical protein
MGDQLVKLLLTGLDEGNPGSTEWCVVYLVSRSASNPDLVTVQEGWTTEEDHDRIFGGAAAQAIVAQFADILADEPTYQDFIAVDGKAVYCAPPGGDAVQRRPRSAVWPGRRPRRRDLTAPPNSPAQTRAGPLSLRNQP